MVRAFIFGSFLKDPETAKDIDVVITAEEPDDMFNAIMACMNLGYRFDKPVDVFFNPASEELCGCGLFDPVSGTWKIDQRFAGQHFFDDCVEVNLDTVKPGDAPINPDVSLIPKPGREAA